MPGAGDAVSLSVEKPAAGGRMIARLDGQIVLVSGAIPGERVRARIERISKGVIYADVVHVDEGSSDRRLVDGDPLCGGCLYAHIAYARQLDLKAQVIADAFARIGRLTLPAPVRVAPSPETGYRMRARLHVRGRGVGFFREGTHELCDVRQTGQLLAASCDAVERFVAELPPSGRDGVTEIELSENVDATERALCPEGWARLGAPTRVRLAAIEGVSAAGPEATVTDRLVVAGAPPIILRRGVRSFFQGNRYLLPEFVAHVVGLVARGAHLVDLYAGSGLFSVTAAALRQATVIAVEGDRVAAGDLQINAQRHAVSARCEAVEDFLGRQHPPPEVVLVDPPRTGMSRPALDGLIRLGAATVVYVSCDAPTLARDARRLIDAGYRIERADAFDLFPKTPHVETVMLFTSS
jgi:23S rRNA (uracil1939-C5)-methyltransferase